MEYIIAHGNGTLWAIMIAVIFYNMTRRVMDRCQFDHNCTLWLQKHYGICRDYDDDYDPSEEDYDY